MANPVVWFEILGKDGKALRKFYRHLFGWRAERLGGHTIVPLTKVPGLDMEKAYIEEVERNVICITRGLSNTR